MSEKKWKEFIQREMDKELEEIEGVLEKINNDPVMREWKAPDGLHDKVLEQIRESQADTERLSDDEKELIRLGMVYKKRRKWNKLLVLAAAVVCALAVGVTSIGGPKKVIEKFGWNIGDREQTNIDTDDERIKEPDVVSEGEAYDKIEEEFGFLPVTLDYLPDGIKYDELIITEGAQNIYLNYIGDNQETIVYFIYLNYRTGSLGQDVEDTLVDEYNKVVRDVTINVKEYLIEENQTKRCMVSYEYQNVCYVLETNNIDRTEVDKIIENLFFN